MNNNDKNTEAIVGLVLGICTMLWFVLTPILSFGTGVGGIILSILALKKGTKKGMAITGLVLSILGIVIMVAFVALVVIAMAIGG